MHRAPIVECARPLCRNTFAEARGKKYCGRLCKDTVQRILIWYAQTDVDSGRVSLSWIEEQYNLRIEDKASSNTKGQTNAYIRKYQLPEVRNEGGR